jgi:hypothetical protein
MLAKIALTLAVVITLVATIAALAGPGDRGPAALNDTAAGMASGGGNLVPLW